MQVRTGQVARRGAEVHAQAVGADERRVAADLVERAHGHRTDRVHAVGSILAADQKQLHAGRIEFQRQPGAVGEDRDLVHPLDERDQLRAGRAGIEKHMVAIAEQFARQRADDFLFVARSQQPGLERKVPFAGQGGAAVDQLQTLLVGQCLQVAADRRVGNLHRRGQFLDRNLLVLKQLRHDLLAAFGSSLAHDSTWFWCLRPLYVLIIIANRHNMQHLVHNFVDIALIRSGHFCYIGTIVGPRHRWPIRHKARPTGV